MKSKLFNIFMLAVVIVVLAVALYAYIKLPAGEQYPVHWSFKGVPDRYGSKAEVVLTGPVMIVVICLMAYLLPKIDPKKLNYDKFWREYNLIIELITVFIAAVYLMMVIAAFGMNVRVEMWVPGLIGVLFIFIGNYMGRIKQNWFVGIKTPWTLSSEKVWYMTHRFGGRVFVIMGIIFILNAFFGFINNMTFFLVLVLGMAFAPVVYSYILYQKYQKEA